MNTQCTDPGQWPHPPDSAASAECVEAFLAHLESCEYHRQIDIREETNLRSLVQFADLPNSNRFPSLDEPSGDRAHLPVSPYPTPMARIPLALAATLAIVGFGLAVWWTVKPSGHSAIASVTTLYATPAVAESPRVPDDPARMPPPDPKDAVPPSAPEARPAGQQSRMKQGTRRPRPTHDARGIASVQTLFLRTPAEPDDGPLCQALEQELRRSGRFTLVNDERAAQAVLSIEPTRGGPVAIRVQSRGRHTIWWMSADTGRSGESGDRTVERHAAKIVDALVDAARP